VSVGIFSRFRWPHFGQVITDSIIGPDTTSFYPAFAGGPGREGAGVVLRKRAQ